MSEFYKILKADPLGDPYTSHGKEIQSYWCQVEGQDKAVMIGKQVGNTLTPGQHVYGDLMYAKSAKGNEYWKFKGSQVPEGVQRPADSPAQAQAQAATGSTPNLSDKMPGWFIPIANQIEFIYKEMKSVSQVEEQNKPDVPYDEPAKETEKAVEQVAGEPLDEVTKATLDDIFGKGEPEPPEEQ